MNLNRLLNCFTDDLKEIYDREEIISIFWIVGNHVYGLERPQLLLKQQIELNDQQKTTFLLILERLKKGEPIQYILGETVFYGLPFKVNSSVLIPRPETEELIEWVIERCAALKPHKIIDIGTGSGCIAIALKKHLSVAEVTAMDISEDSLKVAKTNSLINQVDISFIRADILNYSGAEKFDVIVSNPPYITFREMEDMHKNVLENEPHTALFIPDAEPLLFYTAIADFALKNLNTNGLLFFEINEHYGKEIVDMMRNKSFINIELKKDIQGKDRMITGTLARRLY